MAIGTRIRRSALRRSGLIGTALCVSALVALSASSEAEASQALKPAKQEWTKRTAHQRPVTKTTSPLERLFAIMPTRLELAPPVEAANFDHDAVEASLLRHSLDRTHDGGPNLQSGRSRERLLSGSLRTFLLFGSGQHQSALPVS